MALQTDPEEHLTFTNPHTKVTETLLNLQNHNDTTVIFKIKTTAPKQYFVRPNSGMILSGQSVEIQIGLQPIKDITPDYVCKDKFLIQSASLQQKITESEDLLTMWAKIEKESKDIIFQKKMRVKFDLSSNGITPDNQTTDSLDQAVPPTITTKQDSASKTDQIANGDSLAKDTGSTTATSRPEQSASTQLEKPLIPTGKPTTVSQHPQTPPKATIIQRSTPSAEPSSPVNTTPKPAPGPAEEPSLKSDNSNNDDSSILLLADELKSKTLEIQQLNKLIAEQKNQIAQLQSSATSNEKRSFTAKTSSGNALSSNFELNGVSIATAIFLAIVAFLLGFLLS